MRKLGLPLTLAVSIGAVTSSFSQSTAPTVDPAWKVPEVIQFIGLGARRGYDGRSRCQGRLKRCAAERALKYPKNGG